MGLDGFVTRVGKLRFILIFPANKIGEVCSQILDCFDTHFSRPPTYGILRPQKANAVTDASGLRALMGVVTNRYRRYEHFSQIAELAIEMLKYAKAQQGSVFVVDRGLPADGESSA